LGIVDAGGAVNLADASLADAPDKKWVPAWSSKANDKLTGLASQPNTITSVHILPWANDHTGREADNYLSHLFAANRLTMPDLDLVESGPRAFNFQTGDWAK
jgi:hypothetical protein